MYKSTEYVEIYQLELWFNLMIFSCRTFWFHWIQSSPMTYHGCNTISVLAHHIWYIFLESKDNHHLLMPGCTDQGKSSPANTQCCHNFDKVVRKLYLKLPQCKSLNTYISCWTIKWRYMATSHEQYNNHNQLTIVLKCHYTILYTHLTFLSCDVAITLSQCFRGLT